MVYPKNIPVSIISGYQKEYSSSPYTGYEESQELMFPVRVENKQYPRKEKVIGIEHMGTFKAYPFSELKKTHGTVNDFWNGLSLEIEYDKVSNTATVQKGGKAFPSVTMYWFAWFAFHPDTAIYSQ